MSRENLPNSRAVIEISTNISNKKVFLGDRNNPGAGLLCRINIVVNQSFIPNYGDCYRHGDAVCRIDREL